MSYFCAMTGIEHLHLVWFWFWFFFFCVASQKMFFSSGNNKMTRTHTKILVYLFFENLNVLFLFVERWLTCVQNVLEWYIFWVHKFKMCASLATSYIIKNILYIYMYEQGEVQWLFIPLILHSICYWPLHLLLWYIWMAVIDTCCQIAKFSFIDFSEYLRKFIKTFWNRLSLNRSSKSCAKIRRHTTDTTVYAWK